MTCSVKKWRLRPISECCKQVTSGGTPSRQRLDFFKGGIIPWVKTGELKDWYIDPENVSERITQEAIKNSSAKVFPKGTILMAMYGDGRTIGSLGLVDQPVSSNQACCALVPDQSVCISEFLFYSLMHHRADLIRLAHGGAQRNLSGSIIKKYEIPLPTLQDQKTITSILSAYDALIENNTRRIATLGEMARRLYEEWFVKFRFPGHGDIPVGEGVLPAGWRLGRLDDIVVLQRGFDLPKDQREVGNTPVFAAAGQLGTHSEAKVSGPGVVTGRSGSLGTVTYIPGDFWPLNTALWGKGFPLRSPILAYFALKALDLKGFNSGAAVPTLNRNDVHGVPLPIPPQVLVDRFEEIVRPLFDLKDALRRKNTNLRAHRDLLLPKLISGEIDVSEISEDALKAAE